MQGLVSFDQEFRDRFSIRALAGIDEAGRGPLAGPVVAAAVILPDASLPVGLNDSKKVGTALRARLDVWLREHAFFGVGSASVQEIEQLNILQATFLAMRRALAALSQKPEYTLVDGRDFPFADYLGESVIKGDARSACIAAASIIAKEERDRFMVEAGEHWPQWDFARHKGYGTKVHQEAILRHGLSPLHRKSFCQKLLSRQGNLDLV